jgi:hypothetical protein
VSTVKIVVTKDKPQPFHPFCQVCGWRKAGTDSWDGHGCKCDARRRGYSYTYRPEKGGWVR